VRRAAEVAARRSIYKQIEKTSAARLFVSPQIERMPLFAFQRFPANAIVTVRLSAAE
jgi:hypothetical protein